MKIIKYKLKKSNIYEITLSNNKKYELYDDVILKYELLLNKDISDSKFSNVLKENDKVSCYYIALKYLKTRMRSEKEICKKLNGYDKQYIDYAIKRLKDENYLNDNLYIKAYIADQINLKMIGYDKIKSDLIKLGLPLKEVINNLDKISDDVWIEKINKIINKKINSNHSYSGTILKHKLYQDLIQKGFSQELINDSFDNYSFIDDKRIYEKEYNKAKNKLSKKYSGEELEYKLKECMYKKGFNHYN